MEDFKSAPLTVDPGEVLYQCYGTLWYPNGSLWWERKLVWMQVLSLASEPPGKKGLEVLQSVLLIRRQLVSKDPDQKLHWWVLERERKRSSPPWLEGWVKPTQGFIGNKWRGKGVPRGQRRFFYKMKNKNHNSLSLPKMHSLKICKWLPTPGLSREAFRGRIQRNLTHYFCLKWWYSL